jgi:hypothetical protein
MILEDPDEGRGREDERLSSIDLVRRSLSRADTDQGQFIVMFWKSNSCGLAKLGVLDRGKFDNKHFPGKRCEKMKRVDRIVQMMEDVQKTNIIKLFVERVLKNVVLEKFDAAADYLPEQTGLPKSFFIALNSQDSGCSPGFGLETKIAKGRTDVQNALASERFWKNEVSGAATIAPASMQSVREIDAMIGETFLLQNLLDFLLGISGVCHGSMNNLECSSAFENWIG